MLARGCLTAAGWGLWIPVAMLIFVIWLVVFALATAVELISDRLASLEEVCERLVIRCGAFRPDRLRPKGGSDGRA